MTLSNTLNTLPLIVTNWRTGQPTPISDFADILAFGAVADGNIANAGVNANALSQALLTGRPVRIPWSSAGYHFGTNSIILDVGQTIVADPDTQLFSTVTGSNFFLGAYSLTSIGGIYGATINMLGAGASSTAIRFLTNRGSIVSRYRLGNLRFLNCVEAIGDETSASSWIQDLQVRNCIFESTKGRQIYLKRTRGFILFEDIQINFGEPGITWEGARFEDFIGLQLSKYIVTAGNTNAVYQSTQTGLVINGVGGGQKSVWLDFVLIDSTDGNGIKISNVTYLVGRNLTTFSNLGNAIALSNISVGEFTDTRVVGAGAIAGAAAGAIGISLTACNQTEWTNVQSENNTGSGILLATGSVDNKFDNVETLNNTIDGIVETDTSDRNRFTNVMTSGNGTSNIALAGNGNSQVDLTVSPSFFANKNASDQSGIANATFTKITFGNAVFNTSTSGYSTSTSTFTPPPGTYLIGSTIKIAVGIDQAEFDISIYKNGAEFLRKTNQFSGVGAASASIEATVAANGTDAFTIEAFIAGGGTHTVSGAIIDSFFYGRAV